MKICGLRYFPWQIFLLHILSYLVVNLVKETDAKLGHAGWAKSNLRTKQILQNLRSQLAQQEGEDVAKKRCDPKTPGCKIPESKENDESEEDEKDLQPVLRFKTRYKSSPQVKPKETAPRDVKLSSRKKVAQDEDKEVRPRQKRNRNDDEAESLGNGKREDFEIGKGAKVKNLNFRETQRDKERAAPKPKPETAVARRKPNEEKDDETKKKSLAKPKKPAPKTESIKVEPRREKAFEKKPQVKDSTASGREKRSEQKRKSYRKVADVEDVKFPQDVPVFSLTADAVQSEECKKHSRIFVRQLHKYKLWALNMYDATAKLPSGILQGNVNQYGDFDQCISINATFKKRNSDGATPGIQGKYCLATIDVATESRIPGLQQAVHRSQSLGFVKSTIHDPGHFIPRFSTANWGLCIPSVCKAEDLENSIKASLTSYKKTSGLAFNVKVEETNCVTKKDLLSEYDIKLYITLFFYAAIFGIAVYATLRDVFYKNPFSGTSKRRENVEIDEKSNREQTQSVEDASGAAEEAGNVCEAPKEHGKLNALIMAFSLERNMKKLFIDEESEDSINCIHGIKSIFTLMLYLAHKTIPLALTPFSNRVLFTEMSNEAGSVLLRGSIIYTDSFLLISGVLTSFNLCKEMKKKGRIPWVRRIIARFIRLTPALLATLLFYAYLSDHLGSGPMWNTVVTENSRLCRENMWRNLFYIQNFFPFEEMCAPQTHQLALDMQLFLLSLVLVHLLYEYDKIGVGILHALLMGSSILRFITTRNNRLSLVIFHGMPTSQLHKTANLLYCQPIYRATPYIFGLMVGYYLQKIGKQFDMPKMLVICGWLISSCLGILSFSTSVHLAYQGYEYDVAEAAHYAALSPISWSIALGWVISACYLGYGGKLNEYLSCKGFIVFSRISYSVYLTQFLVFSYFVGIKRIPEMFSFMSSFNPTEFIIVIVLSIITTLLFDIPTVEIKTIILDRYSEPERMDEKRTEGDYGKGKSLSAREGGGYEGATIAENQKVDLESKEEVEKLENGSSVKPDEEYEEEEDEGLNEMNYDRLEGEEEEEDEAPGEPYRSRSTWSEFHGKEENKEEDFWAEENKEEDFWAEKSSDQEN